METRDFTIYSGLDRCVLYIHDDYINWTGVVGLSLEHDIDSSEVYVDGQTIHSPRVYSSFSGEIGVYHFPEEVLEQPFNMSYRVYTNLEHTEYEIHFLYNCLARVSSTVNSTLQDTVDVPGFVLDIYTRPHQHTVPGFSSTPHVIFKTKGMWVEAIEKVEEILYGSGTEDPRFPTIDELVDILEDYAYLKITNHGDGTWTAEEVRAIDIIDMVSNDEFEIDWVSAKYISDAVYTIETY